jgi:hypothetical protein
MLSYPYGYVFYFPFSTTNIPYIVNVCGYNNTGTNPIVDVTGWSKDYFIFTVASAVTNISWFSISPAPQTTEQIFSKFLTKFNSDNINSSFNDLMSSVIIVPSFNTSLNHINDGFIYLSNLLIQFSATNVETHSFAMNSSHTFKFPIDTSNNFIPYMVNVGNSNQIGESIINLINQWSGTSFTVRITNAGNANATWMSIGPRPTIPVYTDTASNFNTHNSVAIAGKIQYICNNTNVYKNTTYGYGNWNNILTMSNPGTYITCSTDGKYVGAVCQTNVYISVDSGSNWTTFNMPSGSNCVGITCSNSGDFFYVTDSNNNKVYHNFDKTNNNYDTTSVSLDAQTQSLPFGITTNSSGKYVYVSMYGLTGGICTSNDYGYNFTNNGILDNGSYKSITTNSTGQYLAIASDIGGGGAGAMYTSSNYGATMTPVQNVNKNWSSIVSDKTGKFLSATATDGIYYSRDYGQTWSITNAPNNSYVCMSMNANMATAITSSKCYVSFNAY